MLLTFENIILIIVILILLNNIKIGSKKEKFLSKNENITTVNIKKKIPIYGDDQFEIKNLDNDDVIYKYQDNPITTKYDKKLIENENYDNKININFNYDESYKNNIFRKTNVPSQQDIIYDTKFNQPSDQETYKSFNMENVNYQGRTIQQVYDELINKPKFNKKKLIKNEEMIEGGFGEVSLSNVTWAYEEDDKGMSYDPLETNQMAIK
jgi:hypothetical protein